MPPRGCDAAVVGGGVGGLAAACYLADAGLDVHVVEKNEQLGGRASVLETDGFRFDMGPSWYLMPDVFERFFGHFGRAPGDFYDLEHLDPHYRIHFKDNAGPRPTGDASGLERRSDGDRVDIWGGGADRGEVGGSGDGSDPGSGGPSPWTGADREQVKAVFERYETGAGAALDDYLAEARRTYEAGMEHFVYEDRSRLRDFADPAVVRHAPGLSLLGTMDDHVADYFDHPRLRQILQYTLVFLGGSPGTTPALYNLMSHVDFNLGVHYPEGGMGSVVDALATLGRDLGATYATGGEVTAIRGRRGGFLVETIPGARDVTADVVVADADYAHVERHLLPSEKQSYGERYWRSRTYAPSAFLLYLGVAGDLPGLAHHTLVLPSDWERHFGRIFDAPAWPSDPAYYVCAPSKTDDSVAPPGHSALFVLVPVAPGLDDGPQRRRAYRETVLDDLAENAGVDLRGRIRISRTFAVSDFAERYNGTRGTALGLAHTLRQTAFLRPSRRAGGVDGLYYTGAYTTPGIGVPMCLISGEHAARAVLEDAGVEAEWGRSGRGTTDRGTDSGEASESSTPKRPRAVAKAPAALERLAGWLP